MPFGVVGPAVAVKVVVTPVLVGGAGLAARRWGEQVGGCVVALPLTSGPVAFFLAREQGISFAARAAIAMMAGTISQVAFALAYRWMCRSDGPTMDVEARCSVDAGLGLVSALLAGSAAFAVSTVVLASVRWAGHRAGSDRARAPARP